MKRNLLTESNEYSRVFADFRGVDFASDPAQVDPSRFPHAVNVWKDYGSENAGFVETIPGFRKLGGLSQNDTDYGKPVNGMFRYGNYVIVHIGNNLYRLRDTGISTVYKITGNSSSVNSIANSKSTGLVYGGDLYVLTGIEIVEVRKTSAYGDFSAKLITDQAYEPTTYQNFKQYEQRNMLTNYAWEEITTGGTVISESSSSEYNYRFSLMGKVSLVVGITVDGTALTSDDFYTESTGSFISAVKLKQQYKDKTVRIRVSLSTSVFDTYKGHQDFMNGNSGYSGSSIIAIQYCTFGCQYDGRIFLSGNPDLPNTVFYAGRDNTGNINPTYFGSLNYFNTGTGQTKNVAMISSYTSLIVLKEASDSEGTVHAYTGVDTGEDLIPRIYTRTEGLPGVGCVGAAANFRDDMVFLSKNGLEAIGKQTVTLERSIEHRSSNVDPKLTAEQLRHTVMAEWLGYLCILVDGKMFLADSRRTFTHHTGDLQYEWWYLEGLGTYQSYRDRYRTVTVLPSIDGLPADILAAPEEKYVDSSPENIHTQTVGETTVYWVNDTDADGNTVKYLVDCIDGEKEGVGTFNPANVCLAVDNQLYFGTSNGDICCFNTDKRGKDKNGYAFTSADLLDKFAPEMYTFAGCAYPSEFATCRDNAGYPHVTKTTVNSSLVVKFKNLAVQSVDIQVSTDRKTLHPISPKGNHTTSLVSSEFDAANIDLGNVGFGDGDIIPFKEKEKKWVEKQFFFRSDDYERPFGVSYLAYRFRVAGKIK